MTVRHIIYEKHGVFYITFTCYKWLNLFSLTNSYDLVYEWFDNLISKGHQIIGYVTMPNHLHTIIALNNSPLQLNTVVSNGKRFMAYEIIKRLENQDNQKLLHELSKNLTKAEKKKGQLHKVFKPSFDVKLCQTNEFICQKLTYMHNNPCSKKWQLVDEPVKYKHSSMKFYMEYDENTKSKLTSYTKLFC
jgi:hypothetical protein